MDSISIEIHIIKYQTLLTFYLSRLLVFILIWIEHCTHMNRNTQQIYDLFTRNRNKLSFWVSQWFGSSSNWIGNRKWVRNEKIHKFRTHTQHNIEKWWIDLHLLIAHRIVCKCALLFRCIVHFTQAIDRIENSRTVFDASNILKSIQFTLSRRIPMRCVHICSPSLNVICTVQFIRIHQRPMKYTLNFM